MGFRVFMSGFPADDPPHQRHEDEEPALALSMDVSGLEPVKLPQLCFFQFNQHELGFLQVIIMNPYTGVTPSFLSLYETLSP